MTFRRQSAGGAVASNGRRVSYVFSTAGVARDGHTIAQGPDAWRLGNFKANPVALWCHDASQPPIGRITSISADPDALRGTIDYAEPDANPLGDTCLRLVKAGMLNCVSVSWDPIRFEYSSDPKRMGGIDFLEQELIEVSQVPIPADVGAIATARSRGIDTVPLAEWAEKALDCRNNFFAGRQFLEALSRAARPARGIYDMRTTPLRSRAEREAVLRRLTANSPAIEDARAARARRVARLAELREIGRT